ncbi:hypothetical protein B488_11730 [Liberibacter crescens BT-1]|uniref:Uncharacterized protein n=1 Tax=Liberibacter crescens (strain BT-1) TaxID=1215343 RepID=L0EWE2_LIBCB|nr:hypothetical protein B488_11730 [Liberibacter crescens BT-1]
MYLKIREPSDKKKPDVEREIAFVLSKNPPFGKSVRVSAKCIAVLTFDLFNLSQVFLIRGAEFR